MKKTLEHIFLQHENGIKEQYPGINFKNFYREFENYAGEIFSSNQMNDFTTNQKINNFIKLVKDGIPFEYISGVSHFYGREFIVGPGVLIPRQETEIIVDEAMKIFKYHSEKISILDICCGSGCIGLSVVCELGEKVDEFLLSDISEKALKYAKINLAKMGFQYRNTLKCEVTRSDLFEKINQKFDLIVCNPPYIKSKEHIDLVHQQVVRFEPHQALFLKDDSYDFFFQRLFKGARQSLEKNGYFFMEGHEQEVARIADIWRKNYTGDLVEVLQDLTGRDRFLKIRKGIRNG